jgi:peptidoglycan hydrolase CwlO-like protein
MVSRKEQDNLRFSNNNLMERNSDLKAEIDAVQSHCNVLQGQNKDLNIELERFVQTDEQIRATLNRRDRVMDLRAKTEGEIQRSYIEVERSSPVRRRF